MLDFRSNLKRSADFPGFLLWQTIVIWQRIIKKTLETFDVFHSCFVIMAIILWLDPVSGIS